MLLAEFDTWSFGFALSMFVGLPLIGLSFRIQALIDAIKEKK
jgi:hypothetical protein